MNRRWSICPTAAATATCGSPGPTGPACVSLRSSGILRFRWAFRCGRRGQRHRVHPDATRGAPGLSLINRDGSGLRQFVQRVFSANWSPTASGSTTRNQRRHALHPQSAATEADDFRAVRQRRRSSSDARRLGPVFRELAHQDQRQRGPTKFTGPDPENGPSEVLARVAGSRVPVGRGFLGRSCRRTASC